MSTSCTTCAASAVGSNGLVAFGLLNCAEGGCHTNKLIEAGFRWLGDRSPDCWGADIQNGLLSETTLATFTCGASGFRSKGFQGLHPLGEPFTHWLRSSCCVRSFMKKIVASYSVRCFRARLRTSGLVVAC